MAIAFGISVYIAKVLYIYRKLRALTMESYRGINILTITLATLAHKLQMNLVYLSSEVCQSHDYIL